MTPASRTASQWQVPAATVPLACSGDQLQRAESRLQALDEQCGERFEQLQRAFEQLPAAAAFDPFAVASSAPSVGAAMAAAPAPHPKGKARMPDAGLRPVSTSAGAWGRVGAAGLTARQEPRATIGGDGAGIAGALAGAAAGRAGLPSGTGTGSPTAAPGAGTHREPVSDEGASLAGWLGSLGHLAALGGEQVALLMQRHAAPALPVGLAGAVTAALARDGKREPPADALRQRAGSSALGAGLGSAAAQALRSVAPTRPPGAAQQASSLSRAGLGLASAWSEAFAAVGWPEAPTSPARPASQVDSGLATAPQLLEQLLAQGLGHAVVGTIGMSAQPAKLARQPAARAASRLVGAQPVAASDQGRGPGPDAPAAAALDALDAGEAMAQQISRLLLDQAWMRGVDLR